MTISIWFKGRWSEIKNSILVREKPEEDSLSYWRSRILSITLLSGVLMGFFVILSIIPMVLENNLWMLLGADTSVLVMGVLLLAFPQIGFKIRATAALGLMYAVGLIIIFNVGIFSGGPAWLLGFAVLAGILLGSRGTIAALSISVVTFWIIHLLMVNSKWGITVPAMQPDSGFIYELINFLFLNALIVISVSALAKGLNKSYEKEKQLTLSLKKEHVKLEEIIRDQAETENALRVSEEKYRNILENIEEIYYETDIKGNLTFSNDATCRVMGYSNEELTGANYRTYMDKENAEKARHIFAKVFRTGVPTSLVEQQVIRKDGSRCFVETIVSLIRDKEGKKIGFRGISRDATDRKKMEDQLRQAHKMESVGTLAGGIAHDFNNMLYIIMGNAELAIRDIPQENPAFDRVEKIKSVGMRGAEIVKQLLNFSQITEQKPELVNMVSLIEQGYYFLRSSLPTTIEIRLSLPAEPLMIFADPQQINQILINICKNASQALGKEGGTLKISAAKQLITKESPGLARGNYAQLRISDTGPGIESDIMDKIFDPYFTTKKFGKESGSGMGLAVVHGIVKDHNGVITVDSSAGKGTVVTVLFPIVGDIRNGD